MKLLKGSWLLFIAALIMLLVGGCGSSEDSGTGAADDSSAASSDKTISTSYGDFIILSAGPNDEWEGSLVIALDLKDGTITMDEAYEGIWDNREEITVELPDGQSEVLNSIELLYEEELSIYFEVDNNYDGLTLKWGDNEPIDLDAYMGN